MNELTLTSDAAHLPQAPVLLWQGRETRANVLSLEDELDNRILRIRSEHMEWAYQTGQTGGAGSLQAALECGDTPSMWWTSLIYERHPKLSPNLYTIYKLRCLEILLQEMRIQKLTVIGADRRIGKAISGICRNYGLHLNLKPGAALADRPDSGPGEKIYWLLPAPLRALARFACWHWQIRRKLPSVSSFPVLPKDNGKAAATIATYFPNIDLHAAGEGKFRSRYWGKLHDLLNSEAESERPHGPHFARWLLIRFPSPDLNFDECLRLRDEFQKKGRDGLSFNFLEEFLTPGAICAALKRWLRLNLASIRHARTFANRCHFANSALDFWPWMAGQWFESLAGWRSLERCLFNHAFRNYYAHAGVQRWTLFPLENCPWERMLTEAARTIPANGPVFGAQHSTVRPTDFRYFDSPETFSSSECAAFQPDKIGGNGDAACRQWRENNMPEERLVQLEALRYLYLDESRKETETDRKRKETGGLAPPQPGEPLEPANGKRLLILTSFFKDETDFQLRLLKRALDAGLLDDWNLVLKPHPYLVPDNWIASLPEEQRNRIFLSHAPLALELTPGTSVWASNSTTASLEAAIRHLPLMVMSASNDFDLCPIQDVPGLLRTATLRDVKRGLENLRPVQPGPDYLDLDPELPAWRKLLGLRQNG